MKIEYTVIRVAHMSNLIATVNAMLVNGWEPVGGIESYDDPTSLVHGKIFLQALIRAKK